MTPEPDLSAISPDLLSEAFEALEEGIAIYDADERLVAFNRRYRELLGPMEDMIRPGMRWRDLIHGCVARGVVSETHDSGAAWEDVSEGDRDSAAKRTEIRQLNGRYFELSYRPTRSGGFVVTRTDVTDRHEAETRADERDRLLSRVLEANPIPVVMARIADSSIVWRSPAAREMIGDVEFARDSYYDADARRQYVEMLKRDGKVEDFRTLCRAGDGRVISVALSGMLTEFGGETCVVSSITDLTEVLEREALIRQVVEAFPAPVLMNRAETGEILYRSPELVDLLGPSLDARSFYVDPADRAGFLAALRRTGAVFDYRERLKNARGEPFWAAVSGRLTEWNGEEVLVTFTRDLTAQLETEAELERQREQMFQNEKMMALGGLMAGVAHELNNPLSVVVGHAMMLQDEVEDAEVLRKTRKISDAAERCARIVKAFLTMARHEPVRQEPTDVNEVIETAVEVARYGDALLGAAVETSLDPGIGPVSSDPDQLTQVVINLALNAAQAIGEAGGTIRIASDQDGATVRIVVEDDGPGVPEDIRGRIFEPFFTTKGVGKGTGIGLAMCHRIVTAHRGEISVESPEGGGARFVVRLPVADAAGATEAEPPVEEAGAGVCRVLVIDDEPDVADLNADILSRGGFGADVAYSAEEAFAALDRGRYDAVVSDLNMPGVDGRGVYEGIVGRQPDLAGRTGFLTGDTMGRTSQTFLGEAKRPYIEKPVSPRELRDFVSRLVSGGAS
ncbi:response regulator [Rhodobacterales bacterium HKCCE2091]|nr:response regulator [Rhodobacterales bacterium HKCCE2091]